MDFEKPRPDSPVLKHDPARPITGRQLKDWWQVQYNRYRSKEHDYRISADVCKHLDFWCFTMPMITLGITNIVLTQVSGITPETKALFIEFLIDFICSFITPQIRNV